MSKKGGSQGLRKPPTPRRKPAVFVMHGESRTDEYSWLQTRSKQTDAYVAAENDYADAYLKGADELRKKLYREIKSRMKEDDMSVPIKDGRYFYFTRVKKGKSYPIHYRRLGKRGKPQLLVDENALAKGHSFFSLGAFEVSRDHAYLAYTVDTTGNEDYTLHIKDLRTGKLLPDTLQSVSDVVWAGNHYIFYTRETHPYPARTVLRHKLGDSPENDVIVYEEKDEQWYASVSRSHDEKYIFIHAANYKMTEVRFIPADDPLATPRLIAERQTNVKYFVEHYDDSFYIMTNDKAVNFKIMRAPVHKPEKKYWKPWVEHRLNRSITGFHAYRNFLVLTMREKGSEEMYITNEKAKSLLKVPLPEDEHDIMFWSETEYESPSIRFTYNSLISPRTVYDYDVARGKLSVRKQQKVPRYKRKEFESERVWVNNNGVRVPVVLAYKKKTIKKPAPMLLTAYGSYGMSNDPHFSISHVSLMNRGWIIAIAHPRGGGEMGWKWHEDAHLLTKHRTTEDFIAVADYLVKQGYTTRAQLAITGGSAGGMLMGQVMNARPDIARAALVYVPAADLIASLLDTTLGGTRLHYDEIGNPNIKEHYEYLMKTSPYENVCNAAYPAILVRASVHDIRTPYWEAAKWVARLRAKGDKKGGPMLLKIETKGGHAGGSGRYKAIEDKAFDQAFLLEIIPPTR